jgi:hypothetical protein
MDLVVPVLPGTWLRLPRSGKGIVKEYGWFHLCGEHWPNLLRRLGQHLQVPPAPPLLKSVDFGSKVYRHGWNAAWTEIVAIGKINRGVSIFRNRH